MGVLAVVLLVQATAVSVFAAVGPSHVHQLASSQAESSQYVRAALTDFRRWSPRPSQDLHGSAFAGHSHSRAHATGAFERHFHDAGDTSVVYDDGDDSAGKKLDREEGSSVAASLAAVPGILLSVSRWIPDELSSGRPWRPSWTPRMASVLPMERPPRST
ncbi:hypothetical protein BH09PSE5_BH09PSE5_44190 [soil metagenome]